MRLTENSFYAHPLMLQFQSSGQNLFPVTVNNPIQNLLTILMKIDSQ
jgi:hypothetical protein